MKSLILYGLIGTFILISSCSRDDSAINTDGNGEATLTGEEIADLNFLREEEKLARDVYLYSYDLYELQIFKNISNSEQAHMNSVLELLEKYNLEDPASEKTGEFNNADLQELYNSLTQQSAISLLEALTVGNIIEDLDIKDIADNEERTTKTDILNVYGLLKCGSRNHLRNYYAQLVQNGGTYVPMYISINEFEDVVSSENEKCINN